MYVDIISRLCSEGNLNGLLKIGCQDSGPGYPVLPSERHQEASNPAGLTAFLCCEHGQHWGEAAGLQQKGQKCKAFCAVCLLALLYITFIDVKMVIAEKVS